LLFDKLHASVAKIQADKVVRWCPDGECLAIFCVLYLASRVQYISDMHSKFALRPNQVWKLVNIQSTTAENKRGKKIERRRKKKPQDENIMSASGTQGGHNQIGDIT